MTTIAYQFFAHGHSGHVEYEQNTNWIFRKGWGLDVSQRAGTINWVHFSVPGFPAGHSMTYLLANYKLIDTRITDLHLYDGRKRFYQQDGLPSFNEQHFVQGDLGGKDVSFRIDRALGISLKVEAGENDGSFSFAAFGAQIEGFQPDYPA